MRTFAFLLLATTLANAAAGPKPHVVFVTGDHEYSGEQTLPLLAKELELHYGLRCTVLQASPNQNAEENIPGLEALATADAAVFYLRWRRLPAAQVAHIDAYLKSGKPVFGFRTSSHAFNYPAGHPLEAWNRWASAVFGAPPGWGAEGHTHFGHDSSTDVTVTDPGHAITRGLPPTFHARSWLYRVLPNWPPAGAEILLTGQAVKPNKPAEVNPIAWTWHNKYGARVFFTTLGHPEDMSLEAVQLLTVKALFWLLDKKPPRWHGRMPIDVPYRGMVTAP